MKKTAYELFAANETRIATYGTLAMELNLSLRRAFKWHFTVADVQTPIIGLDFLGHYGLLVDPTKKRLLDTTTQLTTRGYAANCKQLMIKTVNGDSVYHQLLAKFPDLTRPPAFGREKIRHGVEHHIETMVCVYWPTCILQTPPARTGPSQANQGGICNAYRARSHAPIEEFPGISTTRRPKEGWKSATLR